MPQQLLFVYRLLCCFQFISSYFDRYYKFELNNAIANLWRYFVKGKSIINSHQTFHFIIVNGAMGKVSEICIKFHCQKEDAVNYTSFWSNFEFQVFGYWNFVNSTRDSRLLHDHYLWTVEQVFILNEPWLACGLGICVGQRRWFNSTCTCRGLHVHRLLSLDVSKLFIIICHGKLMYWKDNVAVTDQAQNVITLLIRMHIWLHLLL